MRGLALLAVLFTGFLLPLAGEETASSPPESNAQDSLKTPADTAITSPKGEMERKKQVSTAMLLSTFIPGGGQFYNESYAKGGVIAAAQAALISFTVREQLLMASVDEMWAEDVPDSLKGPKIDALRNLHRDRRNVYAFFTGAVIAFAVSDAYVDAHMFRFKEQQRLSLALPSEGLGLVVSLRF